MITDFLRRYRDLLIVLALIALPFVLYVSNAKEVRDHNAIDRFVVLVSAPIQWLVTSTVDGVIDLWSRYVYLVGTEDKYLELAQENGRLRGELRAREELRLENERLRLLLGLRERAPEVRMAHARVIAESPTPLFRSIRVDRGSSDGVRVGAAVLGFEGLVGRVAALASGHADVMLLVDANSSTDVLVQRTRARARVRGAGDDGQLALEVQYLARTADVVPGDILITSGVGDIFPKGLSVGTVAATEQRAFGLYQGAQVQPSVDFTRLEDVMIVLGTWPEGTSFERAPSTRGPLSPEAFDEQDDAYAPNAVQIDEVSP